MERREEQRPRDGGSQGSRQAFAAVPGTTPSRLLRKLPAQEEKYRPAQDPPSQEAQLSMAASPSDGFRRLRWGSKRLSRPVQQEMDTGREITGEHPSDSPPWEEELVSKIRAMSALEKTLALEAVSHCIQRHSQPGGACGPSAVLCPQLVRKEVSYTSIQELLASLKLDLKQPLEKTFPFHFYGLILRECASVDLVKRHLASLLELCHQSSSQREGIALAIGITSTSHMEEVWAMLEHLGRTRFLQSTFMPPESQQLDPNTHWKWVGSTSLLCLGQIAMHAREQILPWVDNIASRMVYYFSCSPYDNVLKTSFLSAAIMLMKALQREDGTQNYKFTQISELISCLLCVLQKEPNFLATLFRQKIILVITALSNLRPSLKPTVKSKILQTCLQSLYSLPPTETLKRKLPPLEAAPDVMVTALFLGPSRVFLGDGFWVLGQCVRPLPRVRELAETCASKCTHSGSATQTHPPSISQASPKALPRVFGAITNTAALSIRVQTALCTDLQQFLLGKYPAVEGLGHQMLYQKSMQALDLLLQNFVSENKSMDEICFLLQHTEPWLKSDKIHERKRVVHSIFLLLKYVVDHVKLTEEAMPSMLGHQIGLLTLLWRDKDKATQSRSRQCVCLLLQLLIQQKETEPGTGTPVQFAEAEDVFQEEGVGKQDGGECVLSLTHHEACSAELLPPWGGAGLLFPEAGTGCRLRALDENLTVAQHTQLILTLLHELCSRNRLRCDLAAQLLLLIFEDHSIKPEQVAEILQGLFLKLPCIIFKNILQTMMKAVTMLGTQHTQETVEVLLSLCHPSERKVIPLWTALATNNRLARKVVTLLYMKLKLRPPKELVRLPEQAQLISQLALGTIYELLYVREYKATVRWAFAGILLGLLTQLHYLFELDAVEGISDYQEDILEARTLSPCRTCLEALKGLFWTTNYWEVFAELKLLRAWELFEHLETYTEGVTLLARAMAHYDCEVKAVLGQAVISLKSSEERDNIVAILIITEFLNSQELTQYTSRKTMDNFLNLGLNNPNQLVRAMSLKGLSSILMHPKKVVLLRNRLVGLLDSFLKPEPRDLTGLMEILGDIVHCLGGQGVGTLSLKIAQRLLSLFEHAQGDVRAGAIFLYGSVIYSGGRKLRPALRTHAWHALVPLLLHLGDSCPQVVTKTKFTFLRCAILLKWEFRKELFGKLAWGSGLGAENDIFIYMVESNFGSYHQFLMQALMYLSSPHHSMKLAAMRFIGGLLQDYFADLCVYLTKNDVQILLTRERGLCPQPPPGHQGRGLSPLTPDSVPLAWGTPLFSLRLGSTTGFELLKQDRDSTSRRFYRSFLDDVIELSQYVTY
ncbi:maestro heat-like repeat family member 5 [Equus quagga]|uniref:maestro heat-like repeat family member 5 n=1 Tax=Equus quagga TaxID=89248 RepID=UPI001EE2F2DD|nr:maestro heat-like repeat family member 5 [Equus quagga]